jgi:23S rRNA (cytosine1962-C5)-methyltransferase
LAKITTSKGYNPVRVHIYYFCPMKSLKLKSGRDLSLKRRHPWVFSGAVQKVDGDPKPGETVEIISADGKWLARGAFSPQSQIIARAWTFREEEQVGEVFFRRRLEQAVAARGHLAAGGQASACRLCYAESDGLPGLIIDRYAGWLVVQFLSAGSEFWRGAILAQLGEMFPGLGIFDRSDADVRAKEGLDPRTELIKGTDPAKLIEVSEAGIKFLVDIMSGHKTGFYIDQRDNRALLKNYSDGKDVLNCFSYTGGFGLFALAGGAVSVHNIDTSAEALELASRNFQLNSFDPGNYSMDAADVFTALRKFRDSARQFDIIILDPPKFVASASQMDGGTRGYKDINLLALKLLKPGGMLFTFSCSGLVGADLFAKIISDAAVDASREVQVVHHLYQATDHPVSIHFPEGLYLKGLACRVW